MCQWDFPVDEPVSLPSYRCQRVDDSIHLIAQQIRAGASIRALAREYGVSREAIRRAIVRAGVVVEVDSHPQPDVAPRRIRAYRLPGRGRSRALTPVEVAALLARHAGGESLRSLARAVGVSHETMRRTMARTALPVALGASA
jgi:lambda repressor-like predicted transcriptional regulator